LRSQIAIVQQEPILFHRSLAENIAYARILVFEHGHIVEEGNHETLLRKVHGHYRRQFERQAGTLWAPSVAGTG
jgi:ABC-type multidrug transport system fused ATPase/permease subunit